MILTDSEIQELFNYIYDKPGGPTGKRINTLYAKFVTIQVQYCRECDAKTVHKDNLCTNEHTKKFKYPTEIK